MADWCRYTMRAVALGALVLAVGVTSLGIASVANGQQQPQPSVSGLAFVDANYSGARDADEISIAGLPLILSTDTERLETVTDATGRYEFTNVPPGLIALSARPAAISVRPSFFGVAGDARFDIDASGYTPPVTLGLEDLRNFDVAFGILPDGTQPAPPVTDPQPPPAETPRLGAPGSITGMAFIDHNRNSIRDATEIGVSGLPVSLHLGINGFDDSTIVQTVFTNPDGTYEFDSVVPGRYALSYRASGWGPIEFNVGGDDTVDSDFRTATTHSFVVNAEQRITDLDAGFASQPSLFGTEAAQVSGLAFLDENSNGLRDLGESALQDVALTFSLEESAFEVTVATGADGTYRADLIPGSYAVGGLALDNTVVTVPLVGEDRRFDSNLAPAPIIITSSQVLTHFDAGFLAVPAGAAQVSASQSPVPPPVAPAPLPGSSGSISGYISTSGFGGRADVPFTLTRYDDPSSSGVDVGIVQSDENGRWFFRDVEPGFYRVSYELGQASPEVEPVERIEYKTDFYPMQTIIFGLASGEALELLALLDETSIPESVRGDGDCSDSIERSDVELVLRHLTGDSLINGCAFGFESFDQARADINSDGEISVLDALEIAKRLPGCPPNTFLWQDGLCYPIPVDPVGPGLTVTPTPTFSPPPAFTNYGSVPCRPGYVALSNGRCWPTADNTNPVTVTPVPPAE